MNKEKLRITIEGVFSKNDDGGIVLHRLEKIVKIEEIDQNSSGNSTVTKPEMSE